MTGYGRGEAASGPFSARVEIRSVNHRFVDVKIKLPTEMAGFERTLHYRLQKAVRRGRLDVAVSVMRSAEREVPFEINRSLVSSYLAAARQLQSEFGLAGEVTLGAVLALPDALRPRSFEADLTDVEQTAVLAAMDRALEAHEAMREREGGFLAKDVARRVADIERRCLRMQKRAPRMVPLYARRLRDRLKEIDGTPSTGAARLRLDPARLAQEVALTAERSDVTEELVRLKGYLEQLRDLLAETKEPVGKKLDFIMQEMNREANTINSKAIDLALCRDALEVKAEVERIREQVQNIE